MNSLAQIGQIMISVSAGIRQDLKRRSE